jgi:hypothetical protein
LLYMKGWIIKKFVIALVLPAVTFEP